MSQPNQDQNPWGNQPNPQQYQPTQPQPQQFYQQPSQQQYYQQPQPQQNPQVGYFGGAPVPKKKWPGWATALLVIGVVLVIAGIGTAIRPASTTTTTQPNNQQVIATAPASVPTQRAAIQSAPTVATSPKLGKIRETISLNGYSLTVNAVEKSENFSGNSIDQVKAGNVFIAVDLTIGSQKSSGVSANALYASLKDSQGYKYNTGIFGDKEPSLAGENDIPNGDKVRGWVTFEVPKSANGFVLEFSQLFESDKIRVDLGQ